MSSFFKEFLDFITDSRIVSVGLGVIIASQLANVTNVLTSGVINPVINKLMDKTGKKIEDYKFNLFGVDIKLGKIIVVFLNLLIVLLLVFLLWRLLKRYTRDKELIVKGSNANNNTETSGDDVELGEDIGGDVVGIRRLYHF